MTDEVRQEDRCKLCWQSMEAHRLGHYCAMFVTDEDPRVTALRTRIAELEWEKDRLEVAVGWLADVSAATAYSAAELKSTSKAERNRQAVIMEKVIAILDGAPAPTRGAQTGVRARCQRTLAELLATLNGEKKHG